MGVTKPKTQKHKIKSLANLQLKKTVYESQNNVNLEGLYTADCVDFMTTMPDKCVDLVVTSPPYDNLRDYKGYSFEFERIANGLFKVIKEGGVLVWVVGDKINGGRSLTSFRQGIYFQEIGFKFKNTRRLYSGF